MPLRRDIYTFVSKAWYDRIGIKKGQRMSLYSYTGPVKSLLVGRPLKAFGIDFMVVAKNRIYLKGYITIGNPTEKPPFNEEKYLWKAEATILDFVIGEWIVSNCSGGRFGSEKLTAEVVKFVQGNVDGFARIHPDRATFVEPESKKQNPPQSAAALELDTLPAPSEAFPLNWASRKWEAPVAILRPRQEQVKPPEKKHYRPKTAGQYHFLFFWSVLSRERKPILLDGKPTPSKPISLAMVSQTVRQLWLKGLSGRGRVCSRRF